LHDGAPEPWSAAAAAWAALSEPFEAAYCRWREAEALMRTPGGRTAATESLQAAWRAAADLAASPLQARIEGLAQRARITLDVARDAAPSSTVASDLGITAREVEVLGCLARGMTDKQIADDLFISKKTVSVHVSNLLRKLDVTSRFEAAEIAQRLGVPTPRACSGPGAGA
jgi:DNA-binding CsgD family transcriptional regulator